ncbi:hypothetical protein ACFOE1_15205 [Agromyces mediolanus]|uniref:Uncharacterized protein n=1 Tax=Agromyces mediolanus TaxID=41986 RepID=A0A918CHH8_AGRME|nr:hypothetical protein [Agromyces mediolanus]GGR22560.1 hypothetical protein GCM10010196_15320 [Agromyces mediolanus]GLJ71212.1 hypothetical protein GCM10017583_04670 [Agromyces mediolanus]
MPSARPLPTVIGPTENALRELLARTLSPTSIPGYPAWVALNAISAVDARSTWRRRASDGLRADSEEIEQVLAGLQAAGLVDQEERPTAAGAAELSAARTAVVATTLRLVEGIDDAEQETTRHVLDTIRSRAEGLLAAHD